TASKISPTPRIRSNVLRMARAGIDEGVFFIGSLKVGVVKGWSFILFAAGFVSVKHLFRRSGRSYSHRSETSNCLLFGEYCFALLRHHFHQRGPSHSRRLTTPTSAPKYWHC